MYEVEMVNFDNLPEELHDQVPDNGCGKDLARYIIARHKGDIIAVASDAMEPEDAVFYRDLAWIVPALKQAYQLGVCDGRKL